MIQKCRYFNNSHTACSLMIDDLVPIAIGLPNGPIYEKYDGGYLEDNQNSLYKYLEENLIKLFPYLKGTIFLPLSSHKNINFNSGYKIFFNEMQDSFISFLKRINFHFDVAFHGTTHGYFKDLNNFEYKNNWVNEFEYLTSKDSTILKTQINEFESKTSYKLWGGKYTGYKKNEKSESLLEELGFKWWASSAEMCNNKCERNDFNYIGNSKSILDIPTNITGDVFKPVIFKKTIKNRIRKLIRKKFDPYSYLEYLIENQFPITIQEHFQNQRTDGRRQKPNVFDDIFSLIEIYKFLHPFDIWHCTCNELAHYVDSYNKTMIEISGNQIRISYKGVWDKMFLSFLSDNKELFDVANNVWIKGYYKNGSWIFNNLEEGVYKFAYV